MMFTIWISIRPPLQAASAAAEFELVTNETILRRPTEQITTDFLAAIGPA